MNNKTNSKTSSILWTKNTVWFPFLVFLIGTIIVALAAYFMGGTIGRPAGNLPRATLPNIAFNIIWPIMVIVLGLSTYFSWRSKRNRPKKEIQENLITFYVHLFIILFWPLVFYRLESPIIACIILGFAVLSAIYLFYRYLNSSVTAGVLSLIYTLWLLYIFYINISFILLN